MSMTAAGLPPNVATYLAALRAELSDLAPDERDDLLNEVEPSLLEAAADGEEPIEALSPGADPDRRHVFERNGGRTFNAYPIRYFEPGTRRVARPNAGPEVDPPRLRTPPPR